MKISILGTVGVAVLALACSDARPGPLDEPLQHAPPPVAVPNESLDDRPPVENERRVPAISGGTLMITANGRTAVAADPDRDRVSIVDIRKRELLHTIALPSRDEPGRVVEGGPTRAYVALRGGGAVVSIDVVEGVIVARRAVCPAPRGLAYDPVAEQLHVGCSEGKVVTLGAEGDDTPIRVVNLSIGVRDVMMRGQNLVVSRFKTAELVELDPSGRVLSRRSPSGITQAAGSRAFEPAVAWRIVDAGQNRTLMLHQYAFAGEVQVRSTGVQIDSTSGSPPVFEPPSEEEPPNGGGSGDGYGGAVGPGGAEKECGSIVLGAASRFDADGTVAAGLPMARSVLTVDATVSPDSAWVAVAHAGTDDFTGSVIPRGAAPTSLFGTRGGVAIYSADDLFTPPGSEGDVRDCAPIRSLLRIDGQSTAVAFNPDMSEESWTHGPWVVVQSRRPAKLLLFNEVFSPPTEISLGGESVFDTGHDLFHRDTGRGIACASCHVEGREDGRTWLFPFGARRTQDVSVGLEGTEPFHWNGEMNDFAMLTSDVFVRRMGGAPQSRARLDAFARWLFSLEPMPAMVPADDPAAMRGQELFESQAVGCAECHAGEKKTNNRSFHVGTTDPSELLQVPSLLGVGHRAPFVHTGCAESLRDRFDPECGGGDKHGTTSHLSSEQINDLITYLRTL